MTAPYNPYDLMTPEQIQTETRTAWYERNRAIRSGNLDGESYWDDMLCRVGNAAARRGLLAEYQEGIREARAENDWYQRRGPKPAFLGER